MKVSKWSPLTICRAQKSNEIIVMSVIHIFKKNTKKIKVASVMMKVLCRVTICMWLAPISSHENCLHPPPGTHPHLFSADLSVLFTLHARVYFLFTQALHALNAKNSCQVIRWECSSICGPLSRWWAPSCGVSVRGTIEVILQQPPLQGLGTTQDARWTHWTTWSNLMWKESVMGATLVEGITRTGFFCARPLLSKCARRDVRFSSMT